jgi:hypothetical protein
VKPVISKSRKFRGKRALFAIKQKPQKNEIHAMVKAFAAPVAGRAFRHSLVVEHLFAD